MMPFLFRLKKIPSLSFYFFFFYVFWCIWLFRVLWLWSYYRWVRKRKEEHEIHLVQRAGKEVGFWCFTVGTDKNRPDTQRCVHTVTEIAVLSFSAATFTDFAWEAQDGCWESPGFIDQESISFLSTQALTSDRNFWNKASSFQSFWNRCAHSQSGYTYFACVFFSVDENRR